MQDVALYYPTMKVASSSWLKKTLLYWDEVATIVPAAMQTSVRSDAHVSDLIQLGQLRFIDPVETLADPSVQAQIDEAFMYLERSNIGSVGDFGEQDESDIRTEKILYSVRSRLEQQGRGRMLDDSNNWFRTTNSVASWYMSMLTGVVAGKLSGQATRLSPVTDDHRIISASAAQGHDTRRGYVFRVVSGLLPAPGPGVSLRQIVDFKNEHRDELRHLREWMDAEFLLASQLEEELLPTWEQNVRSRSQREIKQLYDAMVRVRWPSIALVGLGAVLGNGMSIANGVLTSNDLLGLGLSIGAGVLGVAAAGPAVVDAINSSRRSTTPLAYAALVRKL